MDSKKLFPVFAIINYKEKNNKTVMKTGNIKEDGKDTQSSQKKTATSNASATASSNKNDEKKDIPTDSSNKGKGPKGENL